MQLSRIRLPSIRGLSGFDRTHLSGIVRPWGISLKHSQSFEQSRSACQGVRLVVVDDDEDLLALITQVTQPLGFQTSCHTSAREVVEGLPELCPDLVLTDLRMPDLDGAELLAHIKRYNPAIGVLIMSVVRSVEQVVKLLRSGADDYLPKPLDPEMLLGRLAGAARRLQLERDAKQLHQLLEATETPRSLVWGTSSSMLGVAARLRSVAQTEAATVIYGESGSGKELIARAIHSASRRAAAPMVAVSCGSVPDGLWEREFFGHVRGAFSDAGSGGAGMVAAADGGTLFLDEVGEIPLPMQAKLLRFLQEKEYRPVGSTESRKANVRIISATNRDLEEQVEIGAFRSDLFYRLNVLVVRIPALRERKEDIPHLASFFLKKHAQDFGKAVHGFTPRALQKLCSYEYPGNVRELENVVQQALVEARLSLITAAEVSVGEAEIREHGELVPSELEPVFGDGPLQAPAPPSIAPSGTVVPYKDAKSQAIEAFERHYSTSILERHDGNVSRAARSAHLTRKSLSRIMARHGLAGGPGGRGGRRGRPPNSKEPTIRSPK